MEEGKGYLVMTLNYHWAGICAGYAGDWVLLTSASSVFRTGNLTTALKIGRWEESEEVGQAHVPLSMIVAVLPCPALEKHKQSG